MYSIDENVFTQRKYIALGEMDYKCCCFAPREPQGEVFHPQNHGGKSW